MVLHEKKEVVSSDPPYKDDVKMKGFAQGSCKYGIGADLRKRNSIYQQIGNRFAHIHMQKKQIIKSKDLEFSGDKRRS